MQTPPTPAAQTQTLDQRIARYESELAKGQQILAAQDQQRMQTLSDMQRVQGALQVVKELQAEQAAAAEQAPAKQAPAEQAPAEQAPAESSGG